MHNILVNIKTHDDTVRRFILSGSSVSKASFDANRHRLFRRALLSYGSWRSRNSGRRKCSNRGFPGETRFRYSRCCNRRPGSLLVLSLCCHRCILDVRSVWFLKIKMFNFFFFFHIYKRFRFSKIKMFDFFLRFFIFIKDFDFTEFKNCLHE